MWVAALSDVLPASKSIARDLQLHVNPQATEQIYLRSTKLLAKVSLHAVLCLEISFSCFLIVTLTLAG